MTRMISTRISDDEFSKIMNKCSALGCSTYEYFKALIQTDLMEEARETKKNSQPSTEGKFRFVG